MSQAACLSHKAAAQHGAVVYVRTGRDDEIVADYSMSDMYRGFFVAVDTTVIETTRSADVAIVADTYILDGTGVEYHHMMADAAHSRGMFVGIIIRDGLHPADQFRPVAVERQDICLMCGELVVDQHFTSACLIQHGDFHSVAELAYAVHQDDVYILDECIVPDFVIGNIVLDVLYATVIPHRDVMERYVAQTGMLLDSSRQREFRKEHAQTYIA